MRPYITATSKATASGTGATGLTIAKPSRLPGDTTGYGLCAGDILVVVLGRTINSNWTAADLTNYGFVVPVINNSGTGNDRAWAVGYKTIKNPLNEPASYLFTHASVGSENSVGLMFVVRGADPNTPFDVTQASNNGSNDFTPAAISITPTSGHCLVVSTHFASMNSGVSGKTGGAPSGYTLLDYVEEATAAGFEAFMEMAWLDQTNPAATTTNAWTGTADDATSEWWSVTIAIRPGTPVVSPGGRMVPIMASGAGETVALTGQGNVAAGSAGSLLLAADFAGRGTAAAGAIGQLDLVADLAGAGHAANTTTAQLDLGADLAGWGDIAATGTADLTVTAQEGGEAVALTGTGDIAVGATADLLLGADFDGFGAAAVSATAELLLTAAFDGQGNIASAGRGLIELEIIIAGFGANATGSEGTITVTNTSQPVATVFRVYRLGGRRAVAPRARGIR